MMNSQLTSNTHSSSDAFSTVSDHYDDPDLVVVQDNGGMMDDEESVSMDHNNTIHNTVAMDEQPPTLTMTKPSTAAATPPTISTTLGVTTSEKITPLSRSLPTNWKAMFMPFKTTTNVEIEQDKNQDGATPLVAGEKMEEPPLTTEETVVVNDTTIPADTNKNEITEPTNVDVAAAQETTQNDNANNETVEPNQDDANFGFSTLHPPTRTLYDSTSVTGVPPEVHIHHAEQHNDAFANSSGASYMSLEGDVSTVASQTMIVTTDDRTTTVITTTTTIHHDVNNNTIDRNKSVTTVVEKTLPTHGHQNSFSSNSSSNNNNSGSVLSLKVDDAMSTVSENLLQAMNNSASSSDATMMSGEQVEANATTETNVNANVVVTENDNGNQTQVLADNAGEVMTTPSPTSDDNVNINNTQSNSNETTAPIIIQEREDSVKEVATGELGPDAFMTIGETLMRASSVGENALQEQQEQPQQQDEPSKQQMQKAEQVETVTDQDDIYTIIPNRKSNMLVLKWTLLKVALIGGMIFLLRASPSNTVVQNNAATVVPVQGIEMNSAVSMEKVTAQLNDAEIVQPDVVNKVSVENVDMPVTEEEKTHEVQHFVEEDVVTLDAKDTTVPNDAHDTTMDSMSLDDTKQEQGSGETNQKECLVDTPPTTTNTNTPSVVINVATTKVNATMVTEVPPITTPPMMSNNNAPPAETWEPSLHRRQDSTTTTSLSAVGPQEEEIVVSKYFLVRLVTSAVSVICKIVLALAVLLSMRVAVGVVNTRRTSVIDAPQEPSKAVPKKQEKQQEKQQPVVVDNNTNDNDSLDLTNYQLLRKVDLQVRLRQRSCQVSGTKAVLIARLVDDCREELQELSYRGLQLRLKAAGLKQTGKKEVLIVRLIEAGL